MKVNGFVSMLVVVVFIVVGDGSDFSVDGRKGEGAENGLDLNWGKNGFAVAFKGFFEKVCVFGSETKFSLFPVFISDV